MAGYDYVPLFLPGCEVSVTAGAAVTAGQVVVVSEDNTVSPSSAASEALTGVAAQTVASGAPLSVWFSGVHVLAASGAIAAGGAVTATDSGAVAAYPTTGGDPATIVGRALSAASNNQVTVVFD